MGQLTFKDKILQEDGFSSVPGIAVGGGNFPPLKDKYSLNKIIKRNTSNKNIIEEAISRNNDHNIKSFSKEENIKNTNKLYDELICTLKKYNIDQNEVVIFGSAILGIEGFRTPNDLDIAIRKNNIPIIKKFIAPDKGSYNSQFTKEKLSFIHELAVPKIDNQNIFDLKVRKYKGIPTITLEQWKIMQKKDPLKKDKRFV